MRPFFCGSAANETNFALASNGAVAGASSRICNDCWLAGNAIDGNGTQWVSLGTVTNNTFVKRNVAFAPIALSQVRVIVTRSLADYTRIVEIEAWGS